MFLTDTVWKLFLNRATTFKNREQNSRVESPKRRGRRLLIMCNNHSMQNYTQQILDSSSFFSLLLQCMNDASLSNPRWKFLITLQNPQSIRMSNQETIPFARWDKPTPIFCQSLEWNTEVTTQEESCHVKQDILHDINTLKCVRRERVNWSCLIDLANRISYSLIITIIIAKTSHPVVLLLSTLACCVPFSSC